MSGQDAGDPAREGPRAQHRERGESPETAAPASAEFTERWPQIDLGHVGRRIPFHTALYQFHRQVQGAPTALEIVDAFAVFLQKARVSRSNQEPVRYVVPDRELPVTSPFD